MVEKEFFTIFDDTVPIRPVYYEGRWVALPLLHLYKQQIKPFTPKGILRSPHKRSVKERDKFCSSLTETLLPGSLKYEELIELCKRHNIPARWVLPPIYIEYPRRRWGDSRREAVEERKNRPLTKEEYKKIVLELREIDVQAELILKVLWGVNRGVGVEEVNGTVQYVTLEEILQLQIEDLPCEDAEDAGALIFRHYGPSDAERHFKISNRLWKALCKHVQGRCLFVFSNSCGAGLSPIQINKHLQNAAKRCQVREGSISSLAFRSYSHEEMKRININLNPYCPVEDDEWELLLREFPGIAGGRGRKSLYDLKDKLNAILYRLQTECSWEKVPSVCSWETLKSQYKRWKKSGILDAILKFRLSLSRSNSARRF